MLEVSPPPVPPAGGPQRRSQRLRNPLLVGAAALGGCVIVSLFDPNTSSLPLCPFKAMTGRDCVGCGATRAVRALVDLDVARALDHNVLWTLTIPFLVYGLVVWLASALGYRLPWPRGLRQRTWLVWPVAALMLVFWAARIAGGSDAWISSGAT